MATSTLKTRVQLKYDSFENWTNNNPTPLLGEICVVIVPATTGVVQQEPAILFKVGNGTTPFNGLDFSSAKAADVYNWAKAATKPTYSASEITGLSDYISGEIDDSDTQYKLELDSSDPPKMVLSSKPLGGDTWTTVSEINQGWILAAIAGAIAQEGNTKRLIVTAVPGDEDALPNVIYMIKDPSVKSGDAYKEYMLIDDEVVQIGDTTVDLSGYTKTEDLADIALSGNVKDLLQTNGDYLILNCGSSSTVI